MTYGCKIMMSLTLCGFFWTTLYISPYDKVWKLVSLWPGCIKTKSNSASIKSAQIVDNLAWLVRLGVENFVTNSDAHLLSKLLNVRSHIIYKHKARFIRVLITALLAN